MNNQPIAKKLAGMILKAMEYRESSYDKAAADAATARMEAEAADDPSPCNAWLYVVNYTEFYRLTLEQAAEKAAVEAGEPTMGVIVYFLISNSWNDVQAWIKNYNLA